ncbi:MAG TPA: flagellar biosynthesis protein FlhF [Phycisphaerae bacterium]|nr:flagellar biosynthesis protein FlhF [Phycisphaerae bacterium]
MKLKTFQARTMAQVLAQVKRALGRDAVILHTRTFTQGGLFGWGGHPVVEITAARHNADVPVYDPTAKAAGKRPGQNGNAGRASSSVAPARPAPDTVGLAAELGDLKELVHELVRETRRSRDPALPEELFDTYLRLVQGRVSDEVARQLILQVADELGESGLRDPAAVRRRLADYVQTMLPTSGPIQLADGPGPTVIALVGPTGVGKTTTIAKLAANSHLRQHRKVGMITVDTYRIAAVEQLRTYAQIIDVPLEVVLTPTQLRAALERLADRDLIFIDTAGRSQNDVLRMNELRCYLEQAKPHEVHLVLASTASQQVVDQVLERFGDLGVNRVIFTKLDEAIGFGVILTSLQTAGAQLSYVTTGQDVPDDIEVGQATRVAELILGESPDGAADHARPSKIDPIGEPGQSVVP